MQYCVDENGHRLHWIPQDSELARKESMHRWSTDKLIIEGPELGYLDRDLTIRTHNIEQCKTETARMLISIANNLDVSRVQEIFFLKVDLLAPEMVDSTRLRPFLNLHTAHFIKCREFTMQRAAQNLQGHAFKVFFTPGLPGEDTLKGYNADGSVVAALYCWRTWKVPHLEHNFLDNVQFRAFIRKYFSRS